MPIQNGFSVTSTCGPSSASRPVSLAGLPIMKVPPGTATMSNETVLPGIVSVYAAAGAAVGAGCAASTVAAPSANVPTMRSA